MSGPYREPWTPPQTPPREPTLAEKLASVAKWAQFKGEKKRRKALEKDYKLLIRHITEAARLGFTHILFGDPDRTIFKIPRQSATHCLKFSIREHTLRLRADGFEVGEYRVSWGDDDE